MPHTYNKISADESHVSSVATRRSLTKGAVSFGRTSWAIVSRENHQQGHIFRILILLMGMPCGLPHFIPIHSA